MANLVKAPRRMFQHTAARRRLLNSIFFGLFSMMFQHTAARRRLLNSIFFGLFSMMFQHTAARRRLHFGLYRDLLPLEFQHTAARRRLRDYSQYVKLDGKVSTHSRPKAAATCSPTTGIWASCFNTQPPEGGC